MTINNLLGKGELLELVFLPNFTDTRKIGVAGASPTDDQKFDVFRASGQRRGSRGCLGHQEWAEGMGAADGVSLAVIISRRRGGAAVVKFRFGGWVPATVELVFGQQLEVMYICNTCSKKIRIISKN